MTFKRANFNEHFYMNEGSLADTPTLELELDEPSFMIHEPQDLLPGSTVPLAESDNEKLDADWVNDKDHSKFLDWLKDEMSNLPSHSGQTTVGCERAIAKLQYLNSELSKAIRSDESNLIDEVEAEDLRDQIYDSIDKLEDAKDKIMDKKLNRKRSSLRIGKEVVARLNDGQSIQYFISLASSDGSNETLFEVQLVEPTNEQVAKFVQNENFTKEAGYGSLSLVEDPFLHSITRLLITSHVTNGKDMNEVYAELKDKYTFTPREELSIHELLHQKGFPLIKDLGRVGEKEINPALDLGVEHATKYTA